MFTGWYRGFILGILDLIRWVGSLLLAFTFYPYLANWLARYTSWNNLLLPPVAFLLVGIIASIIIQLMVNVLLAKLPPFLHSRKINKALGILPGAFSGLVSAAIVAVLLLVVPLPDGLDKQVHTSRFTSFFALPTDRLEMAVAPVFDRAINRTLNKLTLEPRTTKSVALPFKVTKSYPRPDLEAQMLVLVNQERQKLGLTTLKSDSALTRVARLHSADMLRRGYFSHQSPEGKDPFDRLRQAGISFRAAGENLALAPTLNIAHEGLMNSPGHRANILQKRFGRVGIGIMAGGAHQLMVTQSFRN
jgi:uncharacterized protein YkwD